MKKILCDNGFTLIEALVSLVIIALVSIGGLAFFINADEFQAMAMHKKIALEIASSEMEKLRNDESAYSGNLTLGGLSAVQTTTIEPVSGETYKKATVRIDWVEPTKTPKNLNVELVTYIKQ